MKNCFYASKLRLIVAGAHGRMGGLVVRLAGVSDDLTVAAAIDKDKPLELVVNSGDVVVDFTVHEVAARHAEIAAAHNKPIIIGTTGLNSSEEECVKKASRKVPVVYAPNMSIGVNLMLKIIENVSRVLLPKFHVDILEEHHIHKLDRPSGTAKKILEAVISQGKLDAKKDVLICEEALSSEKDKYPVSLCSIRKGETVGDHTIRFTGQGESIEITHRAFGREIFAEGALVAARWIVGKKPGLYSMSDVIRNS